MPGTSKHECVVIAIGVVLGGMNVSSLIFTNLEVGITGPALQIEG